MVAELPVFGAIAGISVAFTLFQFAVAVGIPQDPNRMLTWSGGWPLLALNSANFLVAGLVMWAVIQPVRWLGPGGGALRHAAIGLSVVVAAAPATLIRLTGFFHIEYGQIDWHQGYAVYSRFCLLASLLVVVGEWNRRESMSLESMRAAEADRAALEQLTLKARLKTLEAQIEPHFLFNTLATVRRLYQTDGPAGRAMLDRLMHYLQTALPSMRSERSTLAREAALVTAYLDLQRVRMGRRLEYGLDIAPALSGVEVPPMMLLTLVENAIKHGLAPRREGGRVDVMVRAEAGTLRLVVRDTGNGFGTSTSGDGTGLANVRARLQAMFGSAGGLTLTEMRPHGIEAAIRMPLPGVAP